MSCTDSPSCGVIGSQPDRQLNLDTEVGGPGGHAFPTTSWSLVRKAVAGPASERRERMGQLLAVYWKPVYRYIRASWGESSEDAKDLTQGFFGLLLEGGYLE